MSLNLLEVCVEGVGGGGSFLRIEPIQTQI